MQDFKQRWEIEKNWQLLFPFLGIIALLYSSFKLSKVIISKFTDNNLILIGFLTLLIGYGLLNITLKIFNKLAPKWQVSFRWELIAIFLVFAITGSTATLISGPIINLLGLKELVTNSLLFWTLRILIIFPVYQVLLIFVGWIFGQFKFFWAFEKKMLCRMGLKKLFSE